LQKHARDFLLKDIKTVEELEHLKKKNQRKAKEEKQKAAVTVSTSSLSKNPLYSSFYSGDTLFLSPNFVFNESIFLFLQVDTAFASILTELSRHSKDA
jgi:hypothetical protein